MRETEWGTEHAIDLLQPLNTNTVNQDTFDLEKGGPSILNNGLNRDGGITELWGTEGLLEDADFTYVTSNGLILGLKTNGTVLAATNDSQVTAPLYPSDGLFPSDTLFPSGGYGNTVQLGTLNEFNFFRKAAVPTYYLDCVVSSATTQAGYTYTLLAVRYNNSTTLILDELDPYTMSVLDSVDCTVTSMTSQPGVCIARMNIMTFATVQSYGGFIYNVGTVVHYWRNGTTVRTAPTNTNTDITYQSYTCYHCGDDSTNKGTTIFTVSKAGVSGAFYNATPGTFTADTWTGTAIDPDTSATAIMIGDSNTNVLSDANTTMTLVATTANAVSPVFVITISAAGVVAVATGYGTYYAGQAVGGADLGKAKFTMDYGIVTPYGCAGIYHDSTGTGYGCFHMATAVVSGDPTATPWLYGDLGKFAYPQLDVKHQMLTLRSYSGNIALLTGTAAYTDAADAGNLVNDFAGGKFKYDLASGNPRPNGLMSGTTDVPGAKNFYFYPLSWRGASSTTGVCVYRLNNGDFVSVYSTTTPKFEEIGSGIVALNTLSAWGAIIDMNALTMHYNYSGYTPSFRSDRAASSLMSLKIFDEYSSSLDPGPMPGSTALVQKMSTTSAVGWTAWNVTDVDVLTGKVTAAGNLGDFYAITTTTLLALAPYAPHSGVYVFNANVPPGGDATFETGGIQMLNAVAIQTQDYFGYLLAPQGGNSNLLPWRQASVFLIQGTYYAYNSEFIHQVNLTNGSTGTIVGAPIAVSYAIGLVYLCVSPNKAYFLSEYDNSMFYFDGGRSVVKFFEANQKMGIQDGQYNVRDNALYLQTTDSILTLRDEQMQGSIAGQTAGINVEGLQVTENELPASWTSTSYMKSTSEGLYFVMGNTVGVRSYYTGLDLIPMDYQTSYASPGEWQTMQIGRITGQVYCALNLTADIELTVYYIRIDGTTGSSTATLTTATRNAEGYWRFSWTPPTSNVLAGSVRVRHTSSEQKVVLMELVMYYKAGPEAIPLSEVAS